MFAKNIVKNVEFQMSLTIYKDVRVHLMHSYIIFVFTFRTNQFFIYTTQIRESQIARSIKFVTFPLRHANVATFRAFSWKFARFAPWISTERFLFIYI